MRDLTDGAMLPEGVAEALHEACGSETPRSMPPEFYRAPEMLAIEEQQVFLSGWICLGRTEEIAQPGDYATTEVLGEPLIVARDQDGAVRVLSNVCRHRGSRLVEGSGARKRFVCPYHAWSYGLDGALLRAPLIDAPTHDCNLPSFPVFEWMGWVFVNLDGTAEAPDLSELDPFVAGYHPEEMVAQRPQVESWAVNWKVLAENFMEGYHLTPVHLRTLHPMTPTRLCEKVPGGTAWTGYKSHYDETFAGRSEAHPDMSEEQKRLSMMVWIYPGFVAAISPNSAVYMSLTPVGAEAVQTRWDVIVRAGVSSAEASERLRFAEAFNAEDKARLLDVQKGLSSRFATGGPLAPPDYEGTIHDFYRWMAGRLGVDHEHH